MKKEQLYTSVAEAINSLEDSAELDKQALAVSLMTQGASLAMVNRELPKALAANGVVTDTSTLQVVRDAVKEGVDNDEAVCETWDELVTWADELAEQFSVAAASCVKIIKTALGEDSPERPKLGIVKMAIINYLESYPKGNIEGLADYLEAGTDLTAEKALREARMNYTFAKACFDANN